MRRTQCFPTAISWIFSFICTTVWGENAAPLLLSLEFVPLFVAVWGEHCALLLLSNHIIPLICRSMWRTQCSATAMSWICSFICCSMGRKRCSATAISWYCPFNCCSMGRTRCSATATLMAILWRQKTTATATTSAGGVVLPFLYLLVLVYKAGSKLESSTCESITFGIKSISSSTGTLC